MIPAIAAVLALLVSAPEALAQSGRNPYRMVENWAKLPAGREMGAVGKIAMDPDGRHLWAIVRCDAPAADFGYECLNSNLDSVLKFDLDGNVVASFGGGMFIWPHGIDVDPDGNVWVTDAVHSSRIPKGDKRGHHVIKFSPTGEVLMTLGTPGTAGSDSYSFNSPSDVAVAENGDVYIADGHNYGGNNRVMRYSREGKFIKSWGRKGWAPGEFHALHAIDIDSRGRIFVADRGNNRIQIFNQDGKHLSTWTQFGCPSGIAFDQHGRIYVADSESDNVQNPGWEMGIRIGDAESGWVTDFILFPWGDPREKPGHGAEFVAVDNSGNIYAGEPRPRMLRKYVDVRRRSTPPPK